ncbi:MAG: Motility protein B [Syntrophus sp. PtaU1.Bin005]|nr:MAG: Motility protein B [Syntrophus sp. PtaU1.Bin005]
MRTARAGAPPRRDGSEPLPLKRTTLKPLGSDYRGETNRGTDIWLITLSDLLLLLVIFFVILFSMELQKRVPKLSPGPETSGMRSGSDTAADTVPSRHGRSESLEKELAALLNREQRQRDVSVKREADLVTLTFPEEIVFDPGYARLKSSSRATLETVASFVQERPDLVLEVQGHTDDQPIRNTRYPSNWELSVDRATQVARALIGLGVAPSRLSVKGFGEYRPLYANNRDENRLKNRRVEIQFILPTTDSR